MVVGDITAQQVDAIAMLVPRTLDFEGDLNHKIAAASGTDLDSFILENIYRPSAGDVFALPGFALPCRHILLGVMPRIKSDFEREDHYLSSACRKIMETARTMLLRRVAFADIGAGFGYPKGRSARLMFQGITERLDEDFDEVRIVCSNAASQEVFAERLSILKGA